MDSTGRTPAGRPGAPGGTPAPRQWWRSSLWLWVAVLLGLNLLMVSLAEKNGGTRVEITWSEFQKQVSDGNVASITSTGETIEGHARKAVSSSTDSTQKSSDFTTERPAFADDSALMSLLSDRNVAVTAKSPSDGTSLLAMLLLGFGPSLLLIVAVIWLMRRASAGGGGGVFSMGRSRARLYAADTTPVTLADVAGIDEAKEELGEVIDFLREPQKYTRLGGSIPKGVLLVGPPGTGKTLLARAVAGEARVSFFSVSGSEFVEMLVGVGAARVRDLFAKARAAAPAIIFIDELDAIGRSRGGTMRIGGHEEQEQTLNQILTEMDGFDAREGVVVLAATNRPDVLDPALLRAGRFDRRVFVLPPDRAGRAAILRIHTRGVPLAADVDLDRLASTTPGLVGADLRNLVNEAALLGGRRGREAVTAAEFSEALEKLLLGAARHIAVSPAERERSACHESGHALVGLMTPGADPVRKVSIVPRGRTLGVTVQSPVDDRQMYGENDLRAHITAALGGRAAEALVYGVVSTGAENDLLEATRIAREMVVRWGMSPAIGPLNFGNPEETTLAQPYSPATAQLIDVELRRIVEECFDRARAILRDNRARLDALTRALLAEESLEGDEVLRIVGLPVPAPVAAAAEQSPAAVAKAQSNGKAVHA